MPLYLSKYSKRLSFAFIGGIPNQEEYSEGDIQLSF